MRRGVAIARTSEDPNSAVLYSAAVIDSEVVMAAIDYLAFSEP